MLINELVLQTRDLASLRDFYSRVLNLNELPGEGDTLTIQAGRSHLHFQKSDAGWQGYYHFAFDVPENQLPEAKAWLAERVPLISDQNGMDQFHFDNWNSDSIYFYDPAGNILEFIARHNQANSSDDPFGAPSLIAVTEIGLTCDDVHGIVQRLREEVGIEVYANGEGMEFAPVGDEDGLLILVKQGRVWFPDTGKPAVFAPLSLSLTTAPGLTYRLTGPPYAVQEGP